MAQAVIQHSAGNLVLQRGEANGSISSGDQIGTINFGDESGYSYATIVANAALAPGSDSPGNLQFSTTADGSSSPTERMRIDSSGRLLVGTSWTKVIMIMVASFFSNWWLHVERTAASGNAGISICGNAATGADVGAILYMGRTRASSNGSTNIVAANDLIGRISFQGADGSELIEAAAIRVDVDGTPGANDCREELSSTQHPTDRQVQSSGCVSTQMATSVSEIQTPAAD